MKFSWEFWDKIYDDGVIRWITLHEKDEGSDDYNKVAQFFISILHQHCNVEQCSNKVF